MEKQRKKELVTERSNILFNGKPLKTSIAKMYETKRIMVARFSVGNTGKVRLAGVEVKNDFVDDEGNDCS